MTIPHYSTLLIGGPTTSGKSALALSLAERLEGSIINADSMQVYKELPLLTAQPTLDDQRRVPHFLYSVLDAHDICSVGRWQKMALDVIETTAQQKSFPLIVGGTGLYLSSLTRGIAAVPEISPQIRKYARQLWTELGPEGFYKELEAIDPLSIKYLRPQDQQRVIRAFEVKKASNVSLFEWRQIPDANIQALRSRVIILLPPRAAVYENAERRLLGMLKKGALDEIKRFADLLPLAHLPLVKALGFRPFRAYLQGQLSYKDALERTLYDTRHYIKRQYTWFRHQTSKAIFLERFPSKEEREELIQVLLKDKN